MSKKLSLVLIFGLLTCTAIFFVMNPKVGLLKQHKNLAGSISIEGNTFTATYEGKAKTVEFCCSIQEPLVKSTNNDTWILRKMIPNLSKAVISPIFIVDGVYPQNEPDIWRGPDAPKRPDEREPPLVRIMQHTLDSDILNESRQISVYMPPNHANLKWEFNLPVVYMADGLGNQSKYIEALILQGKLPEMLLVGIEAGKYLGDSSEEFNPALDLRGREYIPDPKDDRFELHERFVIEEVLPWAEATYGASKSPEQRAVHGYSNGGVFAAAMGLRNPDIFAYAMPFSVGINPTSIDPTLLEGNEVNSSFYFVAGELEEGFFRTTKELSQQLIATGIESEFNPRVAGHDYVMWSEAFPDAVLWAFGTEP